ncbi:MAG: phytase [Planctomycetes bacterium]|nr:phytase [Planctomycetota bacterium]
MTDMNKKTTKSNTKQPGGRQLSLIICCALCVLSLPSAARAEVPVITPDVRYANPDDSDQDDMCVWVHPTDKSLSTIVSSDKYANRIFVYSLTGTLIQSVDVGTPGNIDIRYGFSLNGETVDVVGVVGRDAKKILLYKVKSDRTLERIDDDAIFTDDNYGIAMYKSPTSGKYYAFSVSKSGTIKQFELTDDGSGKITGTNVRTMSVSSITEGMVCDDETGKLYVAEEQVGVWKFGAEPDAGTNRLQIAAVGSDGFVSDCEGITLYYRANGEGYIIVSSQGNSTFRILDRKAPHAFIGAFDISNASSTDGIDVCSVNLGSTYPQGAFLCHSGGSSQWGTQWEKIASPLGLTVDTEYWNPRGDLSNPRIIADPLGYQWLTDGTKTATVTATLENFVDFDLGAPYTYTWSTDFGPPDATFGTPVPSNTTGAGEDLSTEVTFDAPGDYVLRVEVTIDTVLYSDTVTVTVYADGCVAAKAELTYNELMAREKGDTNYDCKVNLVDFAAMAEYWLTDKSL